MHHRRLAPLLLLIAVTACQDRTPLAPSPSVPAGPGAPRTTVAGGGTTDLRAGYDYVCQLRGGVVTCHGSAAMGQPIGVHRAAAGTFVQLTAGQSHACALRSDGAVECFGSNHFGEAPPVTRAATGSFTQVSAGNGHTCAVRTDGTLQCWGLNDVGQAPPTRAAQTGTYTEVSAAASSTCALRTDGSIECFGYYETSPPLVPPPDGERFVKLDQSAGANHCAITDTGASECWGSYPMASAGPNVQVVTNGIAVCTLGDGGFAQCTGYPWTWQNGDRSLTDGQAPPPSAPTPQRLPWARITMGDQHTCALRTDGYFECFGLQTIGSNSPDVIPSADVPKSSLWHSQVRVDWRDVNLNDLRTEVQRSIGDAGGNAITWSPAATLGPNRVAYVDSAAKAGAVYFYRIRVCNNAGCSDWQTSNPTRFPSSAPPMPMVRASGYVCGYASCSHVDWTVNFAFVDSFRVQRRVNTGSGYGAWAEVVRLPRETTIYGDFQLTPKATYQYRVAACNVRGCSPYGASNAFVAPKPPAPPAPASLTAARIGYMMYIDWSDVGNETSYELQRRELDNGVWSAWGAPVGLYMNTTEYQQTVVDGTLYQWRIRACNSSGCSAYTYSPQTRA